MKQYIRKQQLVKAEQFLPDKGNLPVRVQAIKYGGVEDRFGMNTRYKVEVHVNIGSETFVDVVPIFPGDWIVYYDSKVKKYSDKSFREQFLETAEVGNDYANS